MKSLIVLLAIVFGIISIVSGTYYLRFVRPDVLGVEETDKNTIKAWEFNNCGIMEVCDDTEGWNSFGKLLGPFFVKYQRLAVYGLKASEGIKIEGHPRRASGIYTEGDIPVYGDNVKLSMKGWLSLHERGSATCCYLLVYTKNNESKWGYNSYRLQVNEWKNSYIYNYSNIIYRVPLMLKPGDVITKVVIVDGVDFREKDDSLVIDWIRITSR